MLYVASVLSSLIPADITLVFDGFFALWDDKVFHTHLAHF